MKVSFVYYGLNDPNITTKCSYLLCQGLIISNECVCSAFNEAATEQYLVTARSTIRSASSSDLVCGLVGAVIDLSYSDYTLLYNFRHLYNQAAWT